jgi:hypothetical protein
VRVVLGTRGLHVRVAVQQLQSVVPLPGPLPQVTDWIFPQNGSLVPRSARLPRSGGPDAEGQTGGLRSRFLTGIKNVCGAE